MGRELRTAPKTDAGRRTVHLPAFVLEVLVTHLARYAQTDADGVVFKELMARLGHASHQAALRYQHAANRDRAIADQLDAVTEQTRRTPPVVPAPPRTRDGRAMAKHAKRPRSRRDASDLGLGKSGRRESNSRSQLGKLMFCL